MERVCAILSHYRRNRLTEECLRRLAAQTAPPVRVAIADNGAGDGSLDAVRKNAARGDYPFELDILEMPCNTGNAGGIACGLEHAFAHADVDAVWILDDDSWPEPDALAQLLKHGPDAGDLEWPCVRACCVVDLTRDGELSWPMVLKEAGTRRRVHVQNRSSLPDAAVVECTGAFLGALVPRAVHEVAGVPEPALFIRGEDEAYPWMIGHAGFRTYVVTASILHHPRPSVELVQVEVGGKAFYYEPGLDAFRLYYKVRNWAWLQRCKYPRALWRRWMACAGYVALCGLCMAAHDGWSLSRFRAVCRGVYRGARGRLLPPEKR